MTNTATAPVDPSLVASCAATASLPAPVSVIDHATRALVDVYTAPARMIEHVAPAEIPVVQEQVIVQEILDAVVPLLPVEEFTEPEYNPVHQERIVAGEITHNIIGNSAVQEQVIVQELPPVAEQTQETIDVVSSITEMPGVPCATPAGPQIGDVGFGKHGELCEVIRIDGRSWHFRGQIRQDSLHLGKTRTMRVGPMDTSQRLHRRARWPSAWLNIWHRLSSVDLPHLPPPIRRLPGVKTFFSSSRNVRTH